jgi:hypothetical protein
MCDAHRCPLDRGDPLVAARRAPSTVAPQPWIRADERLPRAHRHETMWLPHGHAGVADDPE